MSVRLLGIFTPDRVRLVDLQGKLKSSRKQTVELVFDYVIDSIGEATVSKLRCNGFSPAASASSLPG